MPFVLIAIIILVALFHTWIPAEWQSVLYAVSLSIKSIIVFLLPLIIFGLLFKTTVNLAHDATKVIGIILVGIVVSNFLSTSISHYVGLWVYQFDLSISLPEETKGLQAAWQWTLPKLIGNEVAMFSGLILGLVGGYFKIHEAKKLAGIMDKIVGKILQFIIYLIPFFVTGFIFKLYHDGVMGVIIQQYALIFVLIALAQYSYILLAYFLLSRCRWSEFFKSVKNMIPAAITGFSTMSSAASMPLTIIGAEKNAKNKGLVSSVIPATVNVHLVGDCFAIPILAFALMKSFGVAAPDFVSYLIFTCYFVLAKFSVAAIPGGGILVMLPILETYLGLNSAMLSLITALYILFDPVITSANVLGNGAFAKAIDLLMQKIHHRSGVQHAQ
jgi:Na+/H+-dicarboxylate symporter